MDALLLSREPRLRTRLLRILIALVVYGLQSKTHVVRRHGPARCAPAKRPAYLSAP